jgi:hypothetical protein
MTKSAPYSQTVYAIRHKETGLLATNSYYDGRGWEHQYSFNHLPQLYKNRTEILHQDLDGTEYEIIELDLIEVQEHKL